MEPQPVGMLRTLYDHARTEHFRRTGEAFPPTEKSYTASPLWSDDVVFDLRARLAAVEAERDEYRALMERINNTLHGSMTSRIVPDTVETIDRLKWDYRMQWIRANEAEAERDALREALERIRSHYDRPATGGPSVYCHGYDDALAQIRRLAAAALTPAPATAPASDA